MTQSATIFFAASLSMFVSELIGEERRNKVSHSKSYECIAYIYYKIYKIYYLRSIGSVSNNFPCPMSILLYI